MIIRLLCLSVLMGLPALRAQNAFIAYEDGAERPVRAVRSGHPLVEDGTKLRNADATRLGLRPADLYSSAVLTVDQLTVTMRRPADRQAGAQTSYELRYEFKATPDANLENCFLVLEVTYDRGTGVIYQELPNLPAGATVPLSFLFTLDEPVTESHLTPYFFANGVELLTSRMKPAYIATQKRKIEKFMLRSQADRDAAAINPAPPAYPPELKGEWLPGLATVRCQIDATGKLVDARVVSATQPAFGRAALAAVRQWQFGAAIKNHRFVDSTIDIPVAFNPPAEPGK